MSSSKRIQCKIVLMFFSDILLVGCVIEICDIALAREWLWIILICMAAIIATYAFLLAKCIYDRSCNRANKQEGEPQVVNHNDPIIC